MRAIQTFCVHLLLSGYLLLSCSIVLFVLTTTRLNITTTTTTTHKPRGLAINIQGKVRYFLTWKDK